ncbi:MAG: hypothetical protein K0B08_06570 [Bacteroidales bacterium]|nr:hypothetical protein [Bacteroidales bacterium]
MIVRALALMLLIVSFSPASSQFYNGSQMSFGKNRIQYKDFLWTYYKFDDFDIYFYLNGRELAISTAKYALEQIPLMERKLQTGLNQKIQFIVFNNLTDLKQSNIGLTGEINYNTGGIAHISGSKVFLYFNGEQRDFQRQIRAGIAHVLIDQAFYGTSVGSQIKNTALFTLPEWYKQGLVSFLSDEWSVTIDNRVKDGIVSGKYDKLNRLTGEDALYAGHMLWKFIHEKYGRQALTDIVAMTQISRSVENGFLYVIGVSYKTLVSDCLEHFRGIYMAEEAEKEIRTDFFQKKIKKDRVYTRFSFSPGRSHAAWVEMELGRYKIMFQDMSTGKRRCVFRGGFRLEEKVDYTYPLLTWHPMGKLLTFIVERRGEIYMYFYNIDENRLEHFILYNYEKIVDFSYSPDGRFFVFSAVELGQSDLYLFNIASRAHQQLTNDIYDDLHPVFAGSADRILFVSNRPDEKLRWEKIEDAPASVPSTTDLFLLIRSERGNTLRQVTQTPLGNEMRPMMVDQGKFIFLSDENGINNRYIGRFDSTISHVDTTIHYRYFSETYPATNNARSILDHHYDPASSWLSQVVFHDGKYLLQAEEYIPPDRPGPIILGQTSFRKTVVEVAETVKEEKKALDAISIHGPYTKKFRNVFTEDTLKLVQPEAKGAEIDFGNYVFDKQAFIKLGVHDTTTAASSNGKVTVDDKEGFVVPKRLNYRVEYFINEMAAQLDFVSLNYFYQPFGGGVGNTVNLTGLNGFFQIGITDLLEDHRIVGGFRIPLNLNNIEYIFSYANLKKRLDKEVIIVRQASEDEYYFGFYTFILQYRSYQLHYVLTYPFSPVLAVRGTANVRYQKSTWLSTNEPALREPDQNEYWGGLKGEVIYDDTHDLGLNLMTGTRFKIFGEYTQIFEYSKPFNLYDFLFESNKSMFVAGLDIRNYQRIHRTFIWANRIAASTSFGKNKLLYYMGGVDNWILAPEFETSTPIDYSQNYAYQTLATNMRGFNQNARNGNNFVVINSELRFPVIRYFLNRPIKSDFLNNLQLIGFGDIGLAWAGDNPYSEENSFYIRYIQDGSLWIKIREQKEPLIGGFGFGLRTRVFGYFLRGDLAWGVEEGRVLKPKFYLSLGLDF